MAELQAKFTEAMFEIYRRAKCEANYPATIFLRMVTDHGGQAAAKMLINAPRPSDGYTALYLRKRLDLTVEALVAENTRWHSLFTADEIERAKRRLREYRYEPKTA